MNHENDKAPHGGQEERAMMATTISEHGHHDHHVTIDGPWKLNVQGVIIESPQPEIVVRQAIKQAGFNPDTPWIIVLKIAGEPKKEVDLSFVIDLRHKGIEKLRLTPRQINNGEMAAARVVRISPCCRRTRSISTISGCAGKLWSMRAAAGSSSATTRCRRVIASR